MEENSLEKLLKRREVGEPSYGGELSPDGRLFLVVGSIDHGRCPAL